MQNIADKQGVSEDVEQSLGRIGAAGLVVGVPTCNNRETVEHAAEAAAAMNGLGGLRPVLINADGNSRDGTVEHLREIVGDRIPLMQVPYPLYPADRLWAPLVGVPGRKEAALTIFRFARQLGAKVCVLLDAEVESVTPEWVDRLARPVLDGDVDLAVPSYVRHKFDGMINSGILSPFARALFGKRLRQPVGADLAFSAALMDFYLGQAGTGAHGSSALDPWSPVPPILNSLPVGQSFLGPRVVRGRASSVDLSGALQRLLTGEFEQMENTASFWQKVRGSEAVPCFGPPFEIGAERTEFKRKPMIDSFRQGCHDLTDIWRLVLPPATLLELRHMERHPETDFHFADEVWARVVYDFALGYHLRIIGRDHLLQAITPLYLGWAASFTGEMADAPGAEVNSRLEKLSMSFESEKKYLISRWRWPDKFNP